MKSKPASKETSREKALHVERPMYVQHLLFIVETQTRKRVTSAVKVNELRVNMEIFQNERDGSGFAAMSHLQLKGSANFMPANNMQPVPLICQNIIQKTLNLSSFLSWLDM